MELDRVVKRCNDMKVEKNVCVHLHINLHCFIPLEVFEICFPPNMSVGENSILESKMQDTVAVSDLQSPFFPKLCTVQLFIKCFVYF